jgi:hypothetical protein
MKVFMIVGAVLLGSVLLLGQQSVQARPNYCKTFIADYPAVKAAKDTKCGICHEGEPKDKTWNNYGQAFGKALGKKKGDDAEAKAALTKAEGEKSAVDGKTFGDLIKDGKLPASK